MRADFSQIVGEAFQITKRNRRLWVFALILATLSFGSAFNYLGNSNNNKKEGDSKIIRNESQNITGNTVFENTQSPEEMKLGENPAIPNFGSIFENLLKAIPPHVYAIGFIGLIFLAAISIGIALYAKAWATAALIQGIELEANRTYATLYEMSDYAKKHTIELAKLYVIPNLILGVAAFFTIIFGTVLMAVGQSETAGIMLILVYVLIALIVFLIAMMLQGAINLGVMALVLDQLSWKKSLAKGWHIFRKFWLEVSVMYFINCSIGCLVVIGMGILVAIAGGILAAPLLLGGTTGSETFIIAAIPLLIMGVIVFVVATLVIRTLLTVFDQATWVLLYKQLVSNVQPTTVVEPKNIQEGFTNDR